MNVLLAHPAVDPGDYSLALSILTLVAMIVPFVVLGVVARIFWKAKKREDAAKEGEIGGATGDVLRGVGGG